jgi:hypothetical protein
MTGNVDVSLGRFRIRVPRQRLAEHQRDMGDVGGPQVVPALLRTDELGLDLFHGRIPGRAQALDRLVARQPGPCT